MGKDGPRMGQDGSKTVQDGPRFAHDVPKMAPKFSAIEKKILQDIDIEQQQHE